jgi:hypothetical protein
MADPYAGLGSPVPQTDPYAGIGSPVQAKSDPYAGLGTPPAPARPNAPPPAAAPPTSSGGGSWWDNTVKEAQNLRANFDQAVNTGPIMNGVPSLERAGMLMAGRMMGHPEFGSTTQFPMGSLPGDIPGVKDTMSGLGIGRQPGESDASLNARYNTALNSAKTDAQSRIQATTMGSSAPGASLGQRAIRMAQQTGNVGAGIVANPQYLLGPGMAVGPNAAARIGTAALGNAGIGSASDAAAQLMDMANDQKKNFDIEQNLKSAMIGGVFGGAMHGAVEVAPHVKALFANRGMDTTPPADPTAASPIHPMTPTKLTMSPQDFETYKGLLATGSVDDIKGFLQGRQGPQPSYQDINNWVEHRDGATNAGQPVDAQQARPLFSGPDPNYAATQRQAVQDHVDSITKDWKNAPSIEVVHGPEDIADPNIRAQALADDAPGKPNEGAPAFYGADGITRIYSGRAANPDAVTAAVFHEGLGHYGLAQKFGDKLDSVLNSLLGRNVNGLSKDTTQWIQDHPGAYDGNRTRAAEEVLAEASEKGPLKPSWKDALSATMNQFGRKMGFDLSYSDGEVRHILAQAHAAVINGTDVRTNGFQGIPATGQNKFMFTGPHAQEFDPASPTTHIPEDSHPRNEISDHDAQFHEPINFANRLGDHLDHPELYENYPQLHNLPLLRDPSLRAKSGLSGYYDDGSTGHPLGPHIAYDPSVPGDPKPVILHEVQHAIQDIEKYPDFVRASKNGGTGNDPEVDYDNHPSEVEARSVEQRMNMNRGERDRTSPAKFMSPRNEKPEDRVTDSGNFEVRHSTGVVGEPYIHIRPTEQLMPKADNYDRGQAGIKAFRDPKRGWRVLNSSLPEEVRGSGAGREMYRELNNEIQTQYGEHLNSDSKVSKDAQRLWEASGATRNPEARIDPHDGSLIMRDDSPVYSGPAKFMSPRNALGEEQVNPEHLDEVDRLKASPQYWRDPEYRANVNELARTRLPVEDGDKNSGQNKFMSPKAVSDRIAARSDPEDVAKEAYDRLGAGIDNRRPSRSWGAAMEASQNTAIDPSKLRSVRAVGDLDQRLFKYDDAAKQLNTNLLQYADKVSSGQELTADEHSSAIQTVADFHYALGRIENDSAQIARALNAMKAVKFSRNNLINLRQALAESGSTLEGLTDIDTLNKFMAQYKRLGKGPGGEQLVRDLANPGWEKYALTLYRNILLSGTGTHIKAPMDMITGIALDIEDRVGATVIGKMHDALHALGLAKFKGTDSRETVGYLLGAMRAITSGDAWSRASAALKDPLAQTNRVSTEAPAVLPGLAGKITTLPTHLIAAQDAFFRAITQTAHSYGLGIAKSIASGTPGLSYADHIQRGIRDAISNPSNAEAVIAQSKNIISDENATILQKRAAKQQLADATTVRDRANHTLLLSDNPITSFLERGKQLPTGAHALDRAVTAAIDLLTPIIRVPANSLLSRVVARSPFGLLDPETGAMFKAGGSQRDIAISRMAIGTLKLAMYWAAAGTAGTLVGNQIDGIKKWEKEASGWRPNSVKENGGYATGNQLAASINPLDKHNSTATMVADIRQAYEKGANQGQVGKALQLAGSATMRDTFNQLWMGDISKSMGMFSDSPSDTGSATRTVGQIASSVAVPPVISQFRSSTDPYERDTSSPGNMLQSVGNMIENRIPGLSNNLPARYSVYGDPMQTGSHFIGTHNPVTGGNRVQGTTDPTEQELARLSDTTPSAVVTPVLGTITKDDGTKKVLTTPEKERYQQLAGHYIVQDVKNAMSTPRWSSMSDEEKVEEVKLIESNSKYTARRELFDK